MPRAVYLDPLGQAQRVRRTVFVPPVPGHYLFHDATNLAKLTLTNSAVGVNSVDAIIDQGSAGINMTSTTTGRPTWPVFDGERWSGQFDGSNDWMQAASANIAGSQTVFVVCDITSTGTLILLEHSANWNSNNGGIINPDSGTQLTYGLARSGVYSAKSYAVTTTGFHMWSFSADGTHANHRMWRDMTEVIGTTVAPSGTYGNNIGTGSVSTTLNLGSRNAASLFIAMKFQLFLLYNTTLTDGERVRTELAIKEFYGTP